MKGFKAESIRVQKIALGMLLLLIAGSVTAGVSDVKQFSKKIKGLKSMEADFVQTSIDAKGLRIREMKGKAKLARPSKMRWETFAPFEQLMVTNGEKIWLYERDLEQVTINRLDKRSSVTPALVLFKEAEEIEKTFDVEWRKQGGLETFILTPKGKDTLFETLTLTFIKKNLVKIALLDSLNQKTIITFKGSVINKEIANKEFEFEVPKGTDVIRMDN